jgi:proline iminopeptidase
MDVDYMKMMTKYVPGFRWVYLEQRGTGRSLIAHPDKGTFVIDKYVEDLEALRVELGKPKLNLFGNSWGGMLAMAYAAKYPDHVGWMVLADSGGPNTDFIQGFGAGLSKGLTKSDQAAVAKWQTPAAFKKDPDEAATEGLRAMCPGYFVNRAKALEFAKLVPAKCVHAGIIGSVFAEMSAQHYDARPGLKKVKGPVLIIQGREDAVGYNTFTGIHAAMPTSKLVFIPNAGHIAWFEQPKLYFDAINSFLRSAPAS